MDVTFTPADGYDATDEQLNAAEEVIKLRLVNLNGLLRVKVGLPLFPGEAQDDAVFAAVSSTHLDVSKRQAIGRRSPPLSPATCFWTKGALLCSTWR